MADEFSIIDSHAHLDYPQFEGQIDEILARAGFRGNPSDFYWGETQHIRKTSLSCRNLQKYQFSAGIHPHEAANEPDAFNLGAIHCG